VAVSNNGLSSLYLEDAEQAASKRGSEILLK
jgi:hypothetical protein